MSDDGVQIRISPVLSPGGIFHQRHVFRIDGAFGLALCLHTAFVDDLKPDDLTVPMCPMCELFLAVDVADELGVDLLRDSSDWPAGPKPDTNRSDPPKA